MLVEPGGYCWLIGPDVFSWLIKGGWSARNNYRNHRNLCLRMVDGRSFWLMPDFGWFWRFTLQVTGMLLLFSQHDLLTIIADFEPHQPTSISTNQYQLTSTNTNQWFINQPTNQHFYGFSMVMNCPWSTIHPPTQGHPRSLPLPSWTAAEGTSMADSKCFSVTGGTSCSTTRNRNGTNLWGSGRRRMKWLDSGHD